MSTEDRERRERFERRMKQALRVRRRLGFRPDTSALLFPEVIEVVAREGDPAMHEPHVVCGFWGRLRPRGEPRVPSPGHPAAGIPRCVYRYLHFRSRGEQVKEARILAALDEVDWRAEDGDGLGGQVDTYLAVRTFAVALRRRRTQRPSTAVTALRRIFARLLGADLGGPPETATDPEPVASLWDQVGEVLLVEADPHERSVRRPVPVDLEVDEVAARRGRHGVRLANGMTITAPRSSRRGPRVQFEADAAAAMVAALGRTAQGRLLLASGGGSVDRARLDEFLAEAIRRGKVVKTLVQNARNGQRARYITFGPDWAAGEDDANVPIPSTAARVVACEMHCCMTCGRRGIASSVEPCCPDQQIVPPRRHTHCVRCGTVVPWFDFRPRAYCERCIGICPRVAKL